MTTFEELSSSKDGNYKYWTDEAIFHLASYLGHRSQYGVSSIFAIAAKSAFRSSVANRKQQTWLDGSAAEYV